MAHVQWIGVGDERVTKIVTTDRRRARRFARRFGARFRREHPRGCYEVAVATAAFGAMLEHCRCRACQRAGRR